MDNKECKKQFREIAKVSGFDRAFGGWFKESKETIIVLELQKSNFGNYYQLNIKVFIQGVFGETYMKSKKLVKNSIGHINAGETQEYKNFLDLDKEMGDEKRLEGIRLLFKNHIIPFTEKAMTKSGIRELHEREQLFLLPAVKEELNIV